MAVRGITFSKQTVSSNDDSHIYKLLLNGREGITKGCKLTYSKDDIYISDGYFFAANRLMEIPSIETISTPIVTTGTNYYRLVFEIDMSKTNTNSSFEQGYFKILSSTSTYPNVTQEDLENGGNIYQLPFAKFTKTVNGISSFISEVERIGIAAESKTIYVSTSGNDASGDGSVNYPFRSIQKAIDSTPKNLENQTITIEVASGTYSEDVIISGFYGGMIRVNVGTISINTLTVYDCCVAFDGEKITIAANGKTYGIYCHRDANVIVQSVLEVNGSTYGIYSGYASRLNARNTTTVNSCTFAVSATFAGIVYVSNLSGSKNNNGIQAAGGIVMIGSMNTAMASTLYATSNGGRVFTGAQASAPSY